MSETGLSGCKYCGQTALVDAKTEAETVHLATMQCNCLQAKNYKRIHEKAECAAAEMNKLYEAENVPEEVITIMQHNLLLMRDNHITEVQCKLPDGKKLKIKHNDSNYIIECSKADKKKVDV